MRLNLLKPCSHNKITPAYMIEFQHVSKQYSPDGVALRDISFTIAKGELVYLAGPSGAGKSTLLKMIAAMERPTSGKVLVNGQDIGALKRAGIPFLRRNLGLIFQEQRLLNDRHRLTHRGVLGQAAQLRGESVERLLDGVHIGLDDRPHVRGDVLDGGDEPVDRLLDLDPGVVHAQGRQRRGRVVELGHAVAQLLLRRRLASAAPAQHEDGQESGQHGEDQPPRQPDHAAPPSRQRPSPTPAGPNVHLRWKPVAGTAGSPEAGELG